MKRIAVVISTVAAAMMLTTLPVLSAEHAMGNMDQKNECLLVSQKCSDNVDSIQQKIKKLHDEIAKGTRVYTPAELNKLNNKLNEANQVLDELMDERSVPGTK